jgi:peptide/nickel transport system substrate-binding protein
MPRDSYWDRIATTRISRRRVLVGGAVAGGGAAMIALVGCSSSKKSTSPTAAPQGTPQTTGLPVKTRGGIYRNYSFDALSLDTFDPLQTQFGPMYNMHSAVFSKILQYDDDVNQIMSPDLAEAMPEQPDKLTYVIKIRKGIKFHNSPRAQQNYPAVAGRELTAQDVRYSIERQINAGSPQRALYYRSGQWKSIDKIETPDNYTLKITTRAPTSPFLHFLADRNGFIVSKELVDANDSMNTDKAMIGTGPFFLDDFQTTQFVKARRNPDWFARDDNPRGVGTGRPFIDGYDSLWTPQSNSAEEAALKSKQVDSTGFEDDATAIRVSGSDPNFKLYETGVAGWVNSRIWLSSKSPFRDLRLRQALHLGIDRKTLAEQMFPGVPGRRSFLVVGPITYPIVRWAIPQDQLEQRPGYRSDTQGRAQDIAKAKQLWSAAAGPTEFKALFAGIPSYIPQKALPEFQSQLQSLFGVKVDTDVDATGYTTLAQALLQDTADASTGTSAFTWGYDNGWIDLDDWLYPYFHTGGTKNSFLVADPKLDQMLDNQRAEFDYQKRRQIGLDTQNYLLDSVLCRLDYAAPVNRFVDWGYVKNEVIATWFGSNFLFANTWLDQSHPSWSGRPT